MSDADQRGMVEHRSSIEIHAPASVVWQVLVDLAHFAEWNPFIREAHGTSTVGGSVHVKVRPSLGGRLAFHATVVEREEEHGLRWRGQVLAAWLAAGDHTFTIEPGGHGRVRFAQREVFTGLLPWLARPLLERETRRGFEAMNRALKERAERAALASPPPAGAVGAGGSADGP